MGYYSNVFICCEADCTELIAAIKDAEPDFDDVDDGKFRAEFGYRKWYDSYAPVSRIMTEIDKISERQFTNSKGTQYMDLPYGYMEIGEEFNDIVELGRPWHYGIVLVRHLEWGECE